MKSMWRSMVVGLAFALTLQAQGQVITLRASVFEVLVESSSLNGEGDFEGALALLEAVDLSGLTPMELAEVRKTIANTYHLAGQLERARAHFWMVVDEPANVPPELLNGAWSGLATVSFQLEDYEDILRIVRMWRDRVGQPGPEVHRHLALAQFGLGNRDASVAEGELYVAALRAVGDAVPSSFERFLAQARRPEGEVSDPRNE